MPEHPSSHPIGVPFIELQSVDSTNNYALEKIHAGLASHGTAFFAREQYAGKGQRGKTWVAAKDENLVLSTLIRPNLPFTDQFPLSAMIAISVAQLFAKYAGDETSIKWPNDLYWQDRKAGGILLENNFGAESPGQAAIWKWAVAGMGININQAQFPETLQNPVSLRQITGRQFDPKTLAIELCEQLEKNWQILKQQGFEPIYTSYLDLLYKRQESVSFRQNDRVFEALVFSVDRNGSLLLGDKGELAFRSGELEWILPDKKASKKL